MRGVIHYLTGHTEAAERLRNQFLFKIVPMLNPDGVLVGNTRYYIVLHEGSMPRDFQRWVSFHEIKGIVS
jgi:hypothetical protein